MLTFITTVFKDVKPSQEDALFSWKVNNIPVIIVGKYQEVDTIKDKLYGATIIPTVRTESDLGFEGDAPIIKDMIKAALPYITTPMIGLINADILIDETFLDTLNSIVEKHGQDIFLSGPRRDVPDTGRNNSIELIRTLKQRSKEHQGKSGDVFITSKSWWEKMANQMPDLIIGRMVWDNWIHLFFDKKIPCFNISSIALTYHVDHPPKCVHGGPSMVHNYGLFDKEPIDITTWPNP